MKSIVKNKGFMVIEMLIAVSIITVSILVMMAVAQKSVYVAKQAFHMTQASFLLEEGAEAVKILRDNAWANVANDNTQYYLYFSSGTWVLSTTPNTIGLFTRRVSISSAYRDDTTKDIVNGGGTLDNQAKLVIITVSWVEGGVTVNKTLQFYIMDIFS